MTIVAMKALAGHAAKPVSVVARVSPERGCMLEEHGDNICAYT